MTNSFGICGLDYFSFPFFAANGLHTIPFERKTQLRRSKASEYKMIKRPGKYSKKKSV
jgi:hypothetical protein